jgi:prophage antirepressor-like protein
MTNNQLVQFEDKEVRTVWDEDKEEWYISIIDVIEVLTEQNDHQGARNYWKVLKHRLTNEGNQTVTICNRLKLKSEDGKMRLTDVATPKELLRLIQSIPSPKAEPFKLWLAEVGNDRINENSDPELSIERAIRGYRNLGYSENWINQRIKSIEVRKALTDEWDKSGVKQGHEYAQLTNLMTKIWSDKTVKEYKQHKGLKKESLRDNMTNVELVLNMLAEVSATDISIERDPRDFNESADVAREGASVAKDARASLEKRTGKSVISSKNAKLCTHGGI